MAALQETLDLYGRNAGILRSQFKWRDIAQVRASAFALALKGLEADPLGVKSALDLIKTNAGVFSPFRGRVAQLPMACLISAHQDPRGLLQRSVEAYEALRRRRFWASEYLAHAALLISHKNGAQDAERDAEQTAENARAILDELRNMHPLLTSSDAHINIVLLAQNSPDPRDGAHAMERIYEGARPAFFRKSGAYAAAQALAALDKPDAAYAMFDISGELKRRGYNAQWHSAPASLALLALLEEDSGEIAERIAGIAQTIKGMRELGPSWSIAKSELIITASAFALAEKLDINSPVGAASRACPYDIAYSQAIGYLIMLAQSSAGV